jgi:DNA-binding NarL/FixJ family response regulator
MELTERERTVLLHVQFTNDQIAHRLNITSSTVKNHLTNIYKKLGFGGEHRGPRVKRSAAVTEAVRAGLVKANEFLLPPESAKE